jgi:hypothetical protein
MIRTLTRLLCGLLLTGVACTSRTGAGTGTGSEVDRAAGLYAAVIQALAGPARPGGNHPVAFVDGLGDYEFPLEIQASVVQRLKDNVTVRFIDDRTAAVDAAAPGAPVRSDGVLILLTPASPPIGLRVEVVADRYRSLDDVVQARVVLDRSGGSWRVVGSPVMGPAGPEATSTTGG